MKELRVRVRDVDATGDANRLLAAAPARPNARSRALPPSPPGSSSFNNLEPSPLFGIVLLRYCNKIAQLLCERRETLDRPLNRILQREN
tara:strand:- start:22 stop:288 length:267 start_codon:yes stop_codon:yes gene_type:complete